MRTSRYAPPQLLIDVPQRREVSHERNIRQRRRPALFPEIPRTEQIRVRDHRRAERPVFIGARGPRQLGFNPKRESQAAYFTARVTPVWLDTPPTVKVTGCAPGGKKPAGIWTFTCINPENPGAGPAYSTGES